MILRLRTTGYASTYRVSTPTRESVDQIKRQYFQKIHLGLVDFKQCFKMLDFRAALDGFFSFR